MSLQNEINRNLRRAGCFACEPSAETLRLEAWCILGSDIALGFAAGFLAIAALTW